VSKPKEVNSAPALLARAANGESVEHRQLLVAAQNVVREIEAAFYDFYDTGRIYEVAALGDRLYSRVGHNLVDGDFAWMADGRLLLEPGWSRLEAEIRILAGIDPFEVIHEIERGVPQVASMEQLRTFARDLPQILQSIEPDFSSRQHLYGGLPLVVVALRDAYRDKGIPWDWPAPEPQSPKEPEPHEI
jgi:hypothetical protein